MAITIYDYELCIVRITTVTCSGISEGWGQNFRASKNIVGIMP